MEENTEALSTIPEELKSEKQKDPAKMAIVRLHPNDHKVLKVVLKKDKLSFQKFVNFCVRGYLDADPNMLKMIKIMREEEAIPRDVKDKHVLSQRERANILDEIEKGV